MLKVMKYDWRNGWDSVRPTLLAAVVISILAGIAFGIIGGTPVINGTNFVIVGPDKAETAFAIMTIVWFAVMVALLVLTISSICSNMIGRMFGPEGYLTHTLPVHTWELLLGKAVGTWLFGVFMVFVAMACLLLVMFSTAASTGYMGELVESFVRLMPKLGAYHFRQIVSGIGYLLLSIAAFLAWSFLMVVQFQFICIAARQFGKFHVAGGIIVFWLLCSVEGNLNRALSMGFVVFLLSSAACFWGSQYLLKHRLNF